MLLLSDISTATLLDLRAKVAAGDLLGARAVLVKYSPNANFGAAGQSISFSGAQQSGANGIFRNAATAVNSSGSGTSMSQSVNSANGDIVVDSFQDDSGGGAPTKGASQTAIGTGSNTNIDWGSSYEASTGASVTMSWTNINASAAWVYVAGSVAPAAGGGGFTAKERRTLPDQGTRVGSRQVSF